MRDLFDSFPCDSSAFAMKTSCHPCDVSSICVRDHHKRMMSVDVQWRVGSHNRLLGPTCSPQKSCPPWLAAFVPSTVSEAPAIGIPNQSNWPFKARSGENSCGVSWDCLSRRRCDGKLLSEIFFIYCAKLVSHPLHVLLCLSQASVIHAPQCATTRNSQVRHSYKLLIPSKTGFPHVESLHDSMTSSSSSYTKHMA